MLGVISEPTSEAARRATGVAGQAKQKDAARTYQSRIMDTWPTMSLSLGSLHSIVEVEDDSSSVKSATSISMQMSGCSDTDDCEDPDAAKAFSGDEEDICVQLCNFLAPRPRPTAVGAEMPSPVPHTRIQAPLPRATMPQACCKQCKSELHELREQLWVAEESNHIMSMRLENAVRETLSVQSRYEEAMKDMNRRLQIYQSRKNCEEQEELVEKLRTLEIECSIPRNTFEASKVQWEQQNDVNLARIAQLEEELKCQKALLAGERTGIASLREQLTAAFYHLVTMVVKADRASDEQEPLQPMAVAVAEASAAMVPRWLGALGCPRRAASKPTVSIGQFVASAHLSLEATRLTACWGALTATSRLIALLSDSISFKIVDASKAALRIWPCAALRGAALHDLFRFDRGGMHRFEDQVAELRGEGNSLSSGRFGCMDVRGPQYIFEAEVICTHCPPERQQPAALVVIFECIDRGGSPTQHVRW